MVQQLTLPQLIQCKSHFDFKLLTYHFSIPMMALAGTSSLSRKKCFWRLLAFLFYFTPIVHAFGTGQLKWTMIEIPTEVPRHMLLLSIIDRWKSWPQSFITCMRNIITIYILALYLEHIGRIQYREWKTSSSSLVIMFFYSYVGEINLMRSIRVWTKRSGRIF